MRQTIFISSASYQTAIAASTRLDSVLTSAEAALARAEETLRRTQQAYIHEALPHLFDTSVLERYPRYEN